MPGRRFAVGPTRVATRALDVWAWLGCLGQALLRIRDRSSEFTASLDLQLPISCARNPTRAEGSPPRPASFLQMPTRHDTALDPPPKGRLRNTTRRRHRSCRSFVAYSRCQDQVSHRVREEGPLLNESLSFGVRVRVRLLNESLSFVFIEAHGTTDCRSALGLLQQIAVPALANGVSVVEDVAGAEGCGRTQPELTTPIVFGVVRGGREDQSRTCAVQKNTGPVTTMREGGDLRRPLFHPFQTLLRLGFIIFLQVSSPPSCRPPSQQNPSHQV